MDHPAVYALSMKYGPPRVDLRRAEILDGYGDESWGSRPIDHRVPEDVSRGDLAFYTGYAFMGFKDLLFYLYAIAREYERDTDLYIDYYLYSLDSFIPAKSSRLSAVDREALLEGIRWIWDTSPRDFDGVDMEACPNLQTVLGDRFRRDDTERDC